jgi:hypothetical protein
VPLFNANSILFTQIAMLKVLIPVQHYREARVEFMALKARQRVLHNKVSRLQERNRPAHALLTYVAFLCPFFLSFSLPGACFL